MAELLTLVVAGLANGSLYALVGLGLILIYKTQDVINFAYGESLMMGAFAGFVAMAWFHLPAPVAFVGAIAAGAVLGVLIERVAFRSIAHHPHITLAMVTVGLSFTFKGLFRIPFGGDIYTVPPAFGAKPIVLGPLILSPQSLATIIASLLLCAALAVLFRTTRIGKQMRATQQNIDGAKLVGVNTNRIFSAAWALAVAIGAGAGVLAAPISLLYVDMGVGFLLKGFAAAVIGGLTSLPGAVVGGFMLGVLEMLCGGYIATSLQDVSAYIVIIVVLLLRPRGLFGQAAAKRV